MLHTNYQLNPPYTYRRGANLTGIIPEVLKLSVKRCCGDCHEHGASQIDFRHSGFNKEAQKRGYQEVKQELDDNTALHFPLHESSLSTDYSFVSIVESAGVAFIVTEPEPGESARLVVRSVFELWPLVLSMLISAFLSGVIMWLLVSKLVTSTHSHLVFPPPPNPSFFFTLQSDHNCIFSNDKKNKIHFSRVRLRELSGLSMFFW